MSVSELVRIDEPVFRVAIYYKPWFSGPMSLVDAIRIRNEKIYAIPINEFVDIEQLDSSGVWVVINTWRKRDRAKT